MRLAKPYDPRANGVSQSMLTTFMSCRQKAKLKVDGWRAIKPGRAMIFGTMAHACIADAFEKLAAPPDKKWLQARLKQAIKETEEEHGNRLSAEATQNMEKDAMVLLMLLPHYFNYYKKDFEKKSWIRMESKFRVRVPGMPFDIMGYYDRARRVNGKVWLYETKTKGKIDEGFLAEMLHFDFQNGMYLQALELEVKEVPRGVVYDILRNPGIKPKVGESDEKWIARIEKDVRSQPKHYFIRFEVAIDKQEMADFRAQLIAVGKEFDDWVNGKLATYKNTTACKTAWGACDMLPICAREDFSNFVRRKSGRPTTTTGGSK